MTRHITYEIHVSQKGRWEIHARHESSGMDEAIEEARSLDMLASVDEVKVVREVYDDDSGNTKEYNVYRTPGKAAQEEAEATSQAIGGTSGGWAADDGDDDFGSYDASPFDEDYSSMKAARRGKSRKRGGKGKHKATFTSVLVKILLIILFSVTLAGLIAGGTVQFLRDTSLSSNVQTNIV
ncbi:MAG: hypothetical protein HOK06_08095, partial [Rhodospirillaceae bacterium]|nr:hypothetical protein [Rhodospirillaceae bacterium]